MEITEPLTRWLEQAPGLKGLKTEVMCSQPGQASLMGNGSRLVERKKDILGNTWLRLRADYHLRLTLPLETQNPAGSRENSRKLEQLVAWVREKGVQSPPPQLGREPEIELEYPRMEQMTEGVGVYVAALTVTVELEEIKDGTEFDE